MSLVYEIKDYEKLESTQMVGFMVRNKNGRLFAINKEVPLADGKTKEQYVAEALSMCQAEIQEWEENISVVGSLFNPETGQFEP
jgi:hypothetical protein